MEEEDKDELEKGEREAFKREGVTAEEERYEESRTAEAEADEEGKTAEGTVMEEGGEEGRRGTRTKFNK